MSILFKLFFTAFFVFLSSCSTLSPRTQPIGPKENLSWNEREQRLQRIHNWELKGKIGVTTAQNSGSANVDWWQNRGYYRVSLYGPMGAGSMKLEGGPGRVSLQNSNGQTFHANSPEALLAKQWGYQLPVSNLNYWIRGVPVPGLEHKDQFDAEHRLVRLHQDGWVVEYPSYVYTSGMYLPDRINITSPSLRSKLVIYQWNVA